jgi:hypothetical protein
MMFKNALYNPASIIFSIVLLLFPAGSAIYSTFGFFNGSYSTILIFREIAENVGPMA